MNTRLATWGAILGLVVAAGAGALTGSRLAERVSTPATEVVTVTHPASSPRAEVALRSPAGFTGFEDGALAGMVTRTGQVEPGDAPAFEVHTGPARMVVQAASPVRLYRLEASPHPLAPGDVVVVRLDESGAATAVLRVPPDLREGDAR